MLVSRSRSRCLMTVALLLSMSACVSRSSNRDVAKDKERLKSYILDQAPSDVGTRLDIDFNGKVKLLGYRLEPEGVVRPGERLKLVMYWKAAQKLEPGWSLFTHVLDGAGERILNVDNVGPLRELKDSRQALPPGYWDPGKVYVDEQAFAVPATLTTEKMQIVVGIWKDADRLKISSGPHDSSNRGIIATLRTSVAPNPERMSRIPNLRASKLDEGSTIQIDGKLDEEAWKSAASTGPFVNVRTGEPNQSFPVNGSAKVLWSVDGAYFGFQVSDPNILGGFAKDQTDPHLWTKDTVELMLDPEGDGDNKDYYEIQINPQGLVFDSHFDAYNKPKIEPNGPFGHQDWSANVKAKVSIDGTLDNPDDRDQGYTVEVFVLWKSFGKAKVLPPAPNSSWRVNFYAMENNSGVSWSPILDQGNFHKASRFGRVTWTEKPKPSLTKPEDKPQEKSLVPDPKTGTARPSPRAPESVVQRNEKPAFERAPVRSNLGAKP